MSNLSGGPAFPCIIDHPEEYKSVDGSPLTNYKAARLEHVSGMTLLDWFAGMALSGMLADSTTRVQMGYSEIAASSYSQAIEMIEQKEKLA